MDGITGPLVIHSPEDPLKLGTDFDVDQVSLLSLQLLFEVQTSR
jgi:hypothetical protein